MPAAHLALQPRCQAASTAHLSNGKTTPGQAPVVLPRPAHSNNNGRTQLQEAPGQAEAPRPAPGTPGLVSEAHRRSFGPLKVPRKILMGGGPTNVHPRILAAQAQPMLGYFQPAFLDIMDEIQEGLRYLMQTESRFICLLGASGHSGMEAGIANLMEPGDRILIVNQGVWGTKAAEMARRYRGDVIEHQMQPGMATSLAELEGLLEQHKPLILFICHGESSTGVLNPLEGLGELCHRHGCLLQVDAVCSIAGTPLYTDAWGIDCLYAGSQKCLSAPPGATPFMLSERAVHKLRRRKDPPTCYLFDMELNGRYWHWWDQRTIHNTGLITSWYAMREALAIVAEEGLEAIWQRHALMHQRLWQGLGSLGLQPLVADPTHRLPSVNAIQVPEGIDSRAVIDHAMRTYDLEIATGLPPIGGSAWRIGLLGYNANAANVALVVQAFREGLAAQGFC